MNYLLDRYKKLIDAELLIRFTKAWYADPNYTYTPKFEEFRDMFSDGQMVSKFQLLDRIERVDERTGRQMKSILIVGGWYGQLAYLIHCIRPDIKIYSLDIDPRCQKFINSAYGDLYKIKGITKDMYDYDYASHAFDLVINTAMEHIPDHQAWFELLKPNQLVALQSNNMTTVPDHINCATSLQDFRSQVKLSSTEEVVEWKFDQFSRYTIIGKT